MSGGGTTGGSGNGLGLLGEPVRAFVDELTAILGALRAKASTAADPRPPSATPRSRRRRSRPA